MKEQSIRKAIEDGGLSWAVIENLRKKIAVGRLKAIENLDESQCNVLFDKLDGMIPTDPKTHKINMIADQMWILKCMYSITECFSC